MCVCLGHLVEVFEEIQLPRKSMNSFFFFFNEDFQNSTDLYFKLSRANCVLQQIIMMKMLEAQYHNVIVIQYYLCFDLFPINFTIK